MEEKCEFEEFSSSINQFFDKKDQKFEYITKTNGPVSAEDLLVLKSEVQQDIKNNEGNNVINNI